MKFFIQFLYCLAWSILLSCSSKKNEDLRLKEEIDTIPSPKVTVLADLPDSLKPKETYLEKAPKPVTTIFSIPPPTEIFIDSVTGDQIPAVAQGIGFFKNYNMEQGLCSDMVHSIYRDSHEQLWFGTMGSGVARYDGETFTCFTTDHGLPTNTVWSIYEDKKGNMWFGTNDGLSRYDGRNFVNYTTDTGLPGDDVGRIVEDNLGNLWFAILGHGLLKFDGKTFTNFTTEHGLTSNDVWNMIKDHEGKIWCSTRGGGIFYFIPELHKAPVFSVFPMEKQLTNDVIVGMLAKKDGTMWFGTEQNGAFYYDGKELTNFTSADGLNCNTILTIQEDKQGDTWFGTCEGICRFDNETFVSYDAKQGLTNKMVSCMTDDNAGNIWIGTYGGGVFQYCGDSFVNFKSDPVNSNVTTILEDETGQMWFGTRYRGISIYNGQTIITLMPAQGLSRNWINFLMEDRKGDIWFSSFYGGGVQRINHNSSAEFFKPNSEINSPSLKQEYLKPGLTASITTFTTSQGLAFNAVNCIEEDEKGNLWFATYGGGISKFDGSSFTTFTKAQGLVSNDVWDLYEDSRGNLWVHYMAADGITFFNGKSFLNLTTDHGLAYNSVNEIHEDKEGNLLFATLKGISLLRKDKAVQLSNDINYLTHVQESIFETFTVNDGLPGNVIYGIVSDHEGNFLISTNNGLAFLKGGLKAFSNTALIEIFDARHGYPLRNPGIIFEDSRGTFWISTDSDNTGLVRFDPKALHKNWDPPKIILQNIKIENEVVNWYAVGSASKNAYPDSVLSEAARAEDLKLFGRILLDQTYDSIKLKFNEVEFDSIAKWNSIPLGLVLPHQHNNITIDFHAIVTTNNHLVKYQYILEGYDNHWSSPSDKSFASFGNMNEGHYTFKVKACSPTGVWSEPISYSFRVLPPLHKTWWAYSLYGLLFISLMVSGHRYQKQRTIRQEQEKSKQKQAILNERLRISRDLHDEVGATLSGIVMYSHLAKTQANDGNQEVKHSLNIVQETASEMVNKLNDVVWLVNPEQDNLEKLIEKLEDYAGKATESQNIEFKINMPEKMDSFSLPIEVRKNIYLFCKEAINNAVKYSKGTLIEFGVSRTAHDLEFTIKDNGIGFEPESVKRGNGLNNLQKRAEEIGADFILSTKPGKGTLLTLKYKIT